MKRQFVDKAGSAALIHAIEAVEAESSVEVVIKIRHHSGSYLHADIATGGVICILTLAFMIFAPNLHFSNLALILDPILVGGVVGILATQLPWWRRRVTRSGARRMRVKLGAWAGFYERGISRTRARTGMLVYASLLERDIELVCDRGVIETLGLDRIELERSRIAEHLNRNFSGVGLAEAIRELRVVCGTCLPAGDDDINELPDQVHHP